MIKKIVISILITFIMLFLIGSSLFIIGRMMVPDNKNNKAISQYKEIFNVLIDKDFNKAKIDSKEGMCIVYKPDGSNEKLPFNTLYDRRFVNEAYKSEEGNLILFMYGGIFTSDFEVVYTENMLLDVRNYINIKKLDDNIFLCEMNKIHD